MGLTSWENAPDGKIVKADVSIAKNYLKQMELEDMGRIVTAVFLIGILENCLLMMNNKKAIYTKI